jgi:hypothetical protein
METLQQRQSTVAFPVELGTEINLVRSSWLKHATQWGYDPESWIPLPAPPAEFSAGSSAATSDESAGVQSTLRSRSLLQAQLKDLKAQRAVLVANQGEAFDRFQKLSTKAALIK